MEIKNLRKKLSKLITVSKPEEELCIGIPKAISLEVDDLFYCFFKVSGHPSYLMVHIEPDKKSTVSM